MHAQRLGALAVTCIVMGVGCDVGHASEVAATPRDVSAVSADDADMMMKKKAAMAAEADWKQTMAERGSDGAPDAQRCRVDGHALGGFDPVSYHAGEPLRGAAGLAAEHDGVTYVFATAENRDRFVAEPERFVPRYAGWCAMSLALGAFVCPDYENYQIEGGELLLFETTVFTNGRTLWNQDPERHRADADRNFRAGEAR